jgi:hypothetical protein
MRSGSNRCGRPSMSRQGSDSLTNRDSPAAIARRTPGTLTSVATPSRLYSIAAAQPGPSGESSVRTRGAGNPHAARPACTCNCADNAFGSASPGQTFTNTSSVASCSVTAAPTLSSTALTRPSPKPLALAQARIIRSASSALSVPNTLLARSLSYRSVHSSIIQIVHHADSLSASSAPQACTHNSATVGMIGRLLAARRFASAHFPRGRSSDGDGRS